MSYHIVSIDSANCSLSCKDGQLTCKTSEALQKLPLEDVASVIVTSFSASVHSRLLLEAAKHGVALIFCESFRPVSLVLPANRSTDTMLTRAVLGLTEKEKQPLWQRTVEAKCTNQARLIERVAPNDHRIKLMWQTSRGHKPHKEAIVAKLFWQALSTRLGQRDFKRDPKQPGWNALLNYGYAVLLSIVLQKLFGVGLDPTVGVSHAVRERATPLAYDLMEPFRPCVDWRVYQWLKSHPDSNQQCVSKDFRQWITAFSFDTVNHLGHKLEVRGCIESVIRSFRRAVLESKPTMYKPWILRNTKWAG